MKAYCITHRKDVDGLGACSLAVAATGGEPILSDYDDLVENLRRVPDDADRLIITDLGVDTSRFPDFVAELKRISKNAKVTYIDHHYLSERAKGQLRKAKVQLVHDTAESASILTYRTFKDVLPERARLIALCGAVTDYMDDSPIAKKLMEQADRQFVLQEATMLAFALGRKGGADGFPELVVKELAQMKQPHEIENVPRLALEQLDAVSVLASEVKGKGRRMGRLAYMVTDQNSTGNVAKLLIGAFEVPVGVALKEKQEGWYEVSLRSTSESRVHLGKAIDKIASALGGNGGGHAKAAGARIPVNGAETMLKQLAKRV